LRKLVAALSSIALKPRYPVWEASSRVLYNALPPEG
jgi:hypothetical protein